MKKINLEEILDLKSIPKYGYDFTHEHGRIYYREDIIEAMKIFGQQCFNAARELEFFNLPLRYNKENSEPVNKYRDFEDYIKELYNEEK
jgi:hypothetical protein